MDIGAQTLVLIDNSLSVSKVNREITQLTLEYFFAHSPEGRAYCFAPFAHELDYAQSYTTDYIGLADMASRLSYVNKDISITDTLTGILEEWQEGDFACRDILIVTDGKQEAAERFRDEEMFFMINNTRYPVYVLLLEQEGNADAKKDLSAICRLSGGKLFSTEFEGSEAEVERKLSEQIFEAMEKYANDNWNIYENSLDEEVYDDGETAECENDENADLGAEDAQEINETVETDISYGLPNDEEIIFCEEEKENVFDDPLSMGIMGGGLFLAIFACFLCWCFMIRHKRKQKVMDDELKKCIEEKLYDRENGIECEYTGTVSLVRRNSLPESDSSTRLLYEEGSGIDISFEDAANPSKYFRRTVTSKLRLGRLENACDLAFDYDDSVSSVHCEIIYKDGRVFVKDLDSSNGTFVNGQKIYTLCALTDGDMLKLGLLSLIVRF